MKKLAFLSVTAVVALSLVAACGDIPTVMLPLPGSEPTSAPAEPTTDPQVTWPAEAQPLVDLVMAAITKEASTDPNAVEVVLVEEVQWPDGCLGCAKPGQMCTDVIVPGYRIVLRVGDVEYEYRTDKRATVILCRPSTHPGDWGAAQPLVELVMDDLAKRLGIPQDEIQVAQVLEKNWNDSSLGCPQPGYAYLTVITPGYQIILEAGGQQYDYHTGTQANFVLCEK